MRLNRTLTALAVTVSLSAGTAVLGAVPALAAEGRTVVSAPIDGESERKLQGSLDRLYAAIDDAAKNGAAGTYDENDRAVLDSAVMGLIAATNAVAAEPEPPVKEAATDTAAAVADATKKLNAEVKVLVDAAAAGDLVKLSASVKVATTVVVELLVKVGLGPLLEKLGLGDVTKLLPGLTDLLLKPAAPAAGLPALPLPLPALPIPGLPLPGLPTGGLPLPLPGLGK